ncbi:hypothetical protein JCM10213_001508 [Rhodosporidiobolus nylandii]
MLKRILEDQYKPLRVKGYQKPIPQPAPLPSQLFATPAEEAEPAPAEAKAEDEPARPLFPWEYTYKAPAHYNPAPGYRAPRNPLMGPSVKSKEVAAARRAGGAKKARLASALEKTLDYRGGVRPGEREGALEAERHDASMMGPMAAWGGIVENRILQAQREGLFRNVKGRGKPLPKDDAESNPFISRTDFLINRIMKEQDTAPPWVEMQKEVDTALTNFRHELRANWTRRVLRIRSSEGLTQAVVTEVREGWRDEVWEARERAYHDVALLDLNNLTRKYNVIAPYHVRRQLLSLSVELDRAIKACAPAVAKELQRRLDEGMASGAGGAAGKVVWRDPEESVRSVTAAEMGGEKKAVKETMWSAFRRLVVDTLAQPPDPVPARQGSK